MRGIRGGVYVLLGVVAVLIVSGYFATSLGTKKYDSSLMASWVQAIGSIAAIIGAVWVALRQDFREHKIKHQAAVITASGMEFRLRQNLYELGTIADEFNKMSKFDYNPFQLEGLAVQLKSLRKWSSAEEITLIAFDEKCAIDLAAARDRMHFASLTLNEFMGSAESGISEKRRVFAARMEEYLRSAHERLAYSAKACEQSGEKLRKDPDRKVSGSNQIV
ncbi:hypothetical protein [Burkholderia gladioli]|uniref:hypothetical protein n=1 Tax=Burkholderia gladioli TaxID=28095 RepID=UPI00163F8837|nr:hypothetical protein [Burkholderia gladioli]